MVNSTAANAVNAFEAVGIITERTGFKRNRVFAAQDVITILGRPFGETPSAY